MRAPWTVRVATWSARHRWPVFLLWFVATFGLLGASFAAGGISTLDVNVDPNGPHLESETAYDVLGAGEPVVPSERLVVVLSGGGGGAAQPPLPARGPPPRPPPEAPEGTGPGTPPTAPPKRHPPVP